MTDETIPMFSQNDNVDEQYDYELARAEIMRAFNPAKPISENRLFAGRIEEVASLLNVVYESGAHAIIYGERGVGKSSLANIIRDRIPTQIANIEILKENCRPEEAFFDIWAKMLYKFKHEGESVADLLRHEDREFIVLKILEALPKDKQFVFVFDEFDRIQDETTKYAMADTIKHLSDYPSNVTIVIVGVGFSIEELFGAHPSIGRCCRQIHIPRMLDAELSQILDERYTPAGLQCTDNAKVDMLKLSQGLPGYVHLIGREAAISALKNERQSIASLDVSQAIKSAVKLAHESTVSGYERATYSPKENKYKEVLLACALAKTDERGKFSAKSIRDSLAEILGREIPISYFGRHIQQFCSESRGPVLRRTGKPKGYRYQFVEAPMQPYVVMKGRELKLPIPST